MKYDIFDGEENIRERFALGSSGASKLFVFGVNPSTASKDISDTTVTKVGKLSTSLGFQGFVMLNIYPQRATNPDELHSKINESLVERNMKAILSQIQNEHRPQIWAAWGDLINSRNYLRDCLLKIADALKQFDPVWKCYGKPTKLGHPRHPSRVAYGGEFFKFDIDKYLEEKK